MLDLRRQGWQKQWRDDLIESLGRTIPELIRLAEDRPTYPFFGYWATQARQMGTAPRVID